MKTEQAKISARDHRALLNEAERAFPHESCGLLFGEGDSPGWIIKGIRLMRNVTANPTKGFEFDAREHLHALREADEHKLDVIGHFHSHPNGRRGPSPTDLELARTRYDRGLWLIISVEGGRAVEVSAWQLQGEPGEFVQLDLDLSGE